LPNSRSIYNLHFVEQTANSIHDFSSALAYLYSHLNYEKINLQRSQKKVFSLDCIRALLNRLGQPHKQTPMVHITGTAGKGSTTSMIASMLEGGGYRVGQFTSPHLYDIRERFLINKEMMSEAVFVNLIKKVALAALECEFKPTFFELVTAAGFCHFADENVDAAVIEVGFGGRLDSTNVITPLASVVTTIGLDHTHILGDTLTQIAREKAGIFKPGVPAFCLSQGDELDDVFKDIAKEVSAPLYILNKEILFSMRTSSENGFTKTRVSLKNDHFDYVDIPVPLAGEHQAVNCALAISAVESLRQNKLSLSKDDLLSGLSETRAPGRMEPISKSPDIMIDVAHNSLAIYALMDHLKKHLPYKSLTTIFGCCKDKNQSEMILPLLKNSSKLILTKAQNNPRAAEPEDLYNTIFDSKESCYTACNMQEALKIAMGIYEPGDLILVTGSFYVVAEVKQLLK